MAETAGRTLDLADRYINSKCTKYLLRANQVSVNTVLAITAN